jgi:DNA cross-link repair 1A protein
MDIPTHIPDSGGVTVTLIDANHCPGSCLFFFEGPQTSHAGDSTFQSTAVGTQNIFRYLHCGDFRASPKHVHHPVIKGKKIDIIYLDTTYLDPKYIFPSQPEVISACAELVKKLVYGDIPKSPGTQTMSSFFSINTKAKGVSHKQPGLDSNVLFVVGTYSIGKERILKAIALTLGSKVYCDARKTSILHCLNDTELHGLLTSDPLSANVHLVPLSVVASDKLKVYLERYNGHFTKVVGFRPTGWT